LSFKCDWPKCQGTVAAVYSYGKRRVCLCDHHGDMVDSEDPKVMKRARNKVGLPMPEKMDLDWGNKPKSPISPAAESPGETQSEDKKPKEDKEPRKEEESPETSLSKILENLKKGKYNFD